MSLAPCNASTRNLLLQWDIAFLDPPYDSLQEYQRVLQLLASDHLLHPDRLVVAEHRRSLELSTSYGPLERFRLLQQGDAALSFFRMRARYQSPQPRFLALI